MAMIDLGLLRFVRTIRTPNSERFLLQVNNADLGALELHYLLDGAVHATLYLSGEPGWTDEQIVVLLRHLDEVLLPHVSMDDRSVAFTVVKGQVIGDFQAHHTD